MTIRRFDVTEDRVCEYEVYGDMVQDSSGAYVLFEDYYASHAYNEDKEREMLSLLIEARTTLEMWKDVAPAIGLCADIDKFIAKSRARSAE